MSRIGKNPIEVPSGVKINFDDNTSTISVEGPKGTLTQNIDKSVSVSIEDGQIVLSRATEQKSDKSKHGLYRALLSNMVEGVTNGYKKTLELVGVGFKAEVKSGNLLELNLGYSHNIYFKLPEEIKVTAETAKGKSPLVTIESIDKQLIGQVAAKLKSLRKIEPYKGKGVRFQGEQIRRKAGKAAGK